MYIHYFLLDVFPELCTVKLSQISPDAVPKKMVQKQPSTETQQAQQQQQQHPITRTVSQGKRWVFVLVVFVYLILSKLIARSSSASN